MEPQIFFTVAAPFQLGSVEAGGKVAFIIHSQQEKTGPILCGVFDLSKLQQRNITTSTTGSYFTGQLKPKQTEDLSSRLLPWPHI